MLKQRRLEPEWMDDPALEAGLHAGAMEGLERINTLSNSAGLLWPALRGLAREINGRPVKVLDIATGAGDVPIRLWLKARRTGLPLQVEACDRSGHAVEHARRRAAKAGAGVRFFPLDPFSSGIPPGYDAVICSLFLHHLSGDQAVTLLRGMAGAAGRLVAVNDLRRSGAGLALAYAGTRLLTRSPVVHADGPRSVRAAFTLQEIRAMAQQVGLENCRVSPRWPCRFLLTWSKPAHA